MSAKLKPTEFKQPDSFEFTPENLKEAKKQMSKYPAGRQASAVKAMLYLAQNQCGGWIPKVAMDYIASMLQMSPIKVYEVASFYNMFNLQPIGKHLLQVCRTTPCWLRGSDAVTDACKKKLGIDIGETTADGMFTLVEVECLGACVNAPVVQVNNDYVEDLDAASAEQMIDDLRAGKPVRAYSARDRHQACPEGGATTLKEFEKA